MGKDGKKCCREKRKVDDDNFDWDDDKCEKKDNKICVPLRACPAPISTVLASQPLFSTINQTGGNTPDTIAFLRALIAFATGSTDVCRIGLVANALLQQRAVELLLAQIRAYTPPPITAPVSPTTALGADVAQLYNLIIQFLCTPCLWPCNWKDCKDKCKPGNSCNVCPSQNCNNCNSCGGNGGFGGFGGYGDLGALGL